MKYQRLEDLRTDHDLTIRQVADYLGCNRDVYTRYEKGVRQLPISIAIRLAELYQVSLDYLVGISDEKRPYALEFVECLFSEKAQKQFVQQGLIMPTESAPQALSLIHI
mgnify:CR=1 FL=1